MGSMSLCKGSSENWMDLREIDAEHRASVKMGNEGHEALMAGAWLAQLKPILANLLESTVQHFRHEERLMRAIHYEAFDWHKHQHNVALKRSKALAKRIEAGDSGAPGELLAYLAEWLRKHMSVSDRMMSARLRNYLRFNTSLAS